MEQRRDEEKWMPEDIRFKSWSWISCFPNERCDKDFFPLFTKIYDSEIALSQMSATGGRLVSYLFFIRITIREESGSRGGLKMGGMRQGWILVALAVAGCVPAGAEIGGMQNGQPAIAPDMVPDPSYHPRMGDRAVLYAIENGWTLDRLPILKDVTAYDIYVRSKTSGDSERLFDLEQQGWLQWVPPGTRVIVLDIQNRNHAGALTASQIKIPDEYHKNQTFWTPSDYIARLIRKEPE